MKRKFSTFVTILLATFVVLSWAVAAICAKNTSISVAIFHIGKTLKF